MGIVVSPIFLGIGTNCMYEIIRFNVLKMITLLKYFDNDGN